tara:strand:- start:1512 stop:2204 length:693 start_codon:yes stop_codon:yes gene_type:complete
MTNYYLGDPCYVLSEDNDPEDRLWRAFLEPYFARTDLYREKKEQPRYPMYFTYNENDGKFYFAYQDEPEENRIELWESPFGDGCWTYANSVFGMENWICGREIPVDAGLIAVVPVSILEQIHGFDLGGIGRPLDDYGMLFSAKPEIATGEYLDGNVIVQGYTPDGFGECYNCGAIKHGEDFEYCETCGEEGCYDCFNCECEWCDKCRTQVESNDYNHRKDCCVDCAGEEE